MYKWYKNLKIYKKIIALVVIMSVFLIAVGYIGYYFSSKAAVNMDTIYKDRLLPIKQLTRARSNLFQVKSDICNMMSIDNKVQRQIHYKEVLGLIKETDNLISDYSKTKLDEYEIKYLNILIKERNKEKDILREISELTINNEENKAEKLFEERQKNLDYITELIKNLTEYNLQKAAKIDMQSKKDANFAKKIIILSIILAIIILVIIGRFTAETISNPLFKLLSAVEDTAKGNLTKVKFKLEANDETGKLASAFNIMTENLDTLIKREKTLREILSQIRNFKEHDEIYNYLLIQLAYAFDSKQALHLHFDNNLELFVVNEYCDIPERESLLGKVILSKEFIKEFRKSLSKNVVVIRDVQIDVKSSEAKELLLKNNIIAFILYPTYGRLPEEADEKVLGITMICSNTQRNWTQNDIDYYKLTIDTSSIAYSELIQRLNLEQTKETFIATLMHDLKSPIIAVQKVLESIMIKKQDTHISEFIEYIKDIYRTNEEVLHLVNNLLNVYHYESGKYELSITETEIEDIILNAVKMTLPLAKDNESDININIQENLPAVSIDSSEINRVIMNLITNALKHNKKGTNIEICAKLIQNEIEISVKDNGKGISEQEKTNLFNKYPTKKRKIGTGLGLYLSRQIVEAHQGRIWFDSELGKGTTFHFTLPLK